MTRKEIESVYHVEHDTIRDHGQFETAHVSTPHYYDIMMNGCSEPLDDGEDLIEVNDSDRAEFGLETNDRWALLYTSEQGFVDVHFFVKRPEATEETDSE